uniref:Uncharacterized protein n=1 Tax=Oryza brachyantha TaxID=4533 RepID=J3LKZ1_ORYBR
MCLLASYDSFLICNFALIRLEITFEKLTRQSPCTLYNEILEEYCEVGKNFIDHPDQAHCKVRLCWHTFISFNSRFICV